MFLSDVLGIDMTKYAITNEGYGVKYPSEYGGAVKRESISFTLNETDSQTPLETNNENPFWQAPTGQITVGATFLNGYIFWLNINPMYGSVIYRQQPSTSAVAETRNILERYKAYAAKYGMDNTHVTLALSLLEKASDGPAASGTHNFCDLSGFTPTNATSSNMQMTTSQTGIGYAYTFNGVNVPKRSIGASFADETFTFHDTWNLYTVACESVISEGEAAAMALDAAKNYNVTLMREDNSSYVLNPDWSNPTVEISLNMIPGQQFNTQLNQDLNAVSSGSKDRNPLGLYPFWSATVYFTKPIGNIGGVQVGIWGDTKEIAYVRTYGHLGGSGGTDDTTSPFNVGLAVALAAVATAVALAAAFVAVKKRRK